ncbi:hypothetical protein ASPCADRAFT_206624 [Aspergillus carbonarius ITEM 5010]|uniref:Uncharacterized protein n=1 Tax=Aspergillus carbonarius (strain ITEM 5010) TaxID=602072 RepID=A0A1R3RPL6_ASPC5|nr:hypothetical protein ASPCADRAFT_206624 [Aspergillus carbonarius ITEM 5010]
MTVNHPIVLSQTDCAFRFIIVLRRTGTVDYLSTVDTRKLRRRVKAAKAIEPRISLGQGWYYW